jgi:signal peptidase II
VTGPSPGARRLLYFGLGLLIVICDQITKQLVTARIPLHTNVPVIAGFFDLTHVRNAGAAFGIFGGMDVPWRGVFLTLVAVGVFIGVLVYALKTPPACTGLQIALSLILGGAVGNLIDRLRFQSVTDFLRFYIGAHEWPSFNVADSAITVGVVLLAWDIWRRPGERSAEPSGRPAAA